MKSDCFYNVGLSLQIKLTINWNYFFKKLEVSQENLLKNTYNNKIFEKYFHYLCIMKIQKE